MRHEVGLTWEVTVAMESEAEVYLQAEEDEGIKNKA